MIEMKMTDVDRLAELLHNAGLNAFTHPQSKSAEEWSEYRHKLAKYLIEHGCKLTTSSWHQSGTKFEGI